MPETVHLTEDGRTYWQTAAGAARQAEQIARVMELHRAGFKPKVISAETGVRLTDVREIIKKG